MNNSKPTPFSPRSIAVRVAVTATAAGAYLGAFTALHPLLGPSTTSLTLIPTVLGAILLGMRGGAATAVLCYLMTMLLFMLNEPPGTRWFILSIGYGVMLAGTGVGIGWLGDMVRVARRQAVELENERIALKHEYADRIKAQETLAATENNFDRVLNDIIDGNPYPIALLDLEGHYIRSNAAITRVFGSVPPPEYSCFTDPRLLAAGFGPLFGDVRAGKTVQFPDMWINPHDNNPQHPDVQVCVTAMMFPLRNSAGDTINYVLMHQDVTLAKKAENQILSINADLEKRVNERTRQLKELNDQQLHDITQRKRAEWALRESEARYRAIVQDQSELICRFRSCGTLTFVNDAYCRYFNKPAEELIGMSFFDILAPQDVGTVRAKLALLTHERPSSISEHRVVMPDQTVRWHQWTDRAIFDSAGATMEYQAVGRDITDMKAAIFTIEQSERFLQNVFDSIQDGISVLDTDLRIVRINKTLSGAYPHISSFTGHKCYEVFHGRQLECTVCPSRRALETGIQHMEVVPLDGPDGTTGSLEVHAFPLVNPQGKVTGVVEYVRDITLKTKTDQMLANAQKLESLGILAGGIAHDFNNLLTGIFGHLDLARTLSDPHTPIGEILSEASRTLNRARALTQQLLTFSKGGAPVCAPASIASMLKSITGFVLTGSNVNCVMDLPADLYTCEVDENQISQAIDNILINARQAMPEGGTIRLSAANITLPCPGDPAPLKGQFVRIDIADTGSGIPPHILPKIFDPFFTTKTGGSGLGLATTFSIVKKHGGHIGVDSHPGKGTIFSVYLPAALTEAPLKTEKPPLLRRGEGKILLMDDEELVRKTTVRILQGMGFTVQGVTNGQEAIDTYRSARETGAPFSLLVLDLTIPGGMGGKAALAEILTMDSGVRAIAASGYSNDPVIAEPTRFGFRAALRKPFTIHELMDIIEMALN